MKTGYWIILAWILFVIMAQNTTIHINRTLVDKPLSTLVHHPDCRTLKIANLPDSPYQTSTSPFSDYTDQLMQSLVTGNDHTQIRLHIVYAADRRPDNILTDYLKRLLSHYQHKGTYYHELVDIKPGVQANLIRFQATTGYKNIIWFMQSPGKTSTRSLSHLLWQYGRELIPGRTDGCGISLTYDGPPQPTYDDLLIDLAGYYHDQINDWLNYRPGK